MLEPIKDSVLFAFEDDVDGGKFYQTSESGIFLGSNSHLNANAPRWGRVIAKGPDADSISNGDRILIEPTQWTFGMTYDGVKIWRTIESKIICVDEK